MHTVSDMRTLAEREQDDESDWAPSRARSINGWWRCVGGTEEPGTGVWTFHQHREIPLQESTRRLRGDQSYPSLHLGKGTKWIKPRSTR